MIPADFDNLSAACDRELKRLPALRAPHTFLSRVMTSTRPSRRAWHTRVWLAWPVGWQMLSTAALGALVAALLPFIPHAYDIVASANSRFTWRPPTFLTALAANIESATSFTRIAWHVWLQPIVSVVFILGIVVSLGCFACWPAVRRLALGGAPQS